MRKKLLLILVYFVFISCKKETFEDDLGNTESANPLGEKLEKYVGNYAVKCKEYDVETGSLIAIDNYSIELSQRELNGIFLLNGLSTTIGAKREADIIMKSNGEFSIPNFSRKGYITPDEYYTDAYGTISPVNNSYTISYTYVIRSREYDKVGGIVYLGDSFNKRCNCVGFIK